VSLVTPGPLAVACAGSERPVPSWLIRLLGTRLVVQGGFLLIRPTDEVVVLGTAADALHGASMLVVVVVKPEYRRSALVAAFLAAASVAVGARVKKQ
jgi:hypothetical protein